MGNSKRTYFRISILAGILLVLFLAAVLLPQYLINQPSVKKRIIDLASRKTGVRLYYRDADVSFFPRPCAVVHDGHVSLDGTIRGNLKSLAIYLKILPLLSGGLEIAELGVENPEFDVTLPPDSPVEKKEGEQTAPRPGDKNAAPRSESLAPRLPFPAVTVKNGWLTLRREGRPTLQFRKIQADLEFQTDKLRVAVRFGSGISEKIDLKAWIDPGNRKGSGYLHMEGLRLQKLAGWLPHGGEWRVGDSLLNLKFNFNMNGFEDLRGKLEGTIPRLTVKQGEREVEIRGNRLAAAVQWKNDVFTFTLDRLALETPKLDASGMVAMDRSPGPRPSSAPPRIRLEVTGRNVDVDSTREAGMALLGNFETARGIFDIVRGGPAPRITYGTQGNTWDEAGNIRNMHLEGSLRRGRLSVPVDFDLEAVSGDLTIYNGVMEGKNLKARWNSAEVHGGYLRWDIKEKTDPFHLELAASCGVADLPAILRRFVDDETVLKELGRIHDIGGTASGKVVLGEYMKTLDVDVDVTDFHLSARHPMAPYPLEILGGRLTYSKRKINVKKLNGRFGSSTFNGIAGGLDWKKAPVFEIPSGEIRLAAGEYDAWLASFETFKEDISQTRAVGGEILVAGPSLSGRLFDLSSWEFRIPGEFNNLVLESAWASSLLTLSHGRFELARTPGQPKRTSFEDAHVSMMDGDLTITGNLIGKPGSMQKAKLDFRGEIGPASIKWLSDVAALPPEFIPRSPLSIPRGSLEWENDAGLSIAGDLAVKDGPEASLDIRHAPGTLEIRELIIRDKESRAAITMNIENGVTAMEFEGALTSTTLDGLLEDNRFPRGAVEGYFRVLAPDDRPLEITATGAIAGRNLVFPQESLAPLVINSIAVRAEESDFNVKSADLMWEDHPLNISGYVGLSPAGVELALNASTNRLYWSDVKKMMEKDETGGEEGKKKDEAEPSQDVRVYGKIRLKSDSFQYEDFTWAPLETEIELGRDGAIDLNIIKADLCGISLPGEIHAAPGGEISFRIHPGAENKDLNVSLPCLLDEKLKISGSFDLEGRVEGRGKDRALVESLKGELKLTAKKGRVNRFSTLSKTLALLNLTEVFVGKTPDLVKEGFAYNTITANGRFDSGKFILDEGYMDAASMGIASQGYADLMEKKVDGKVLLAPFKTMDRVFGKIPVASDITGGSIVSIPFSVKGELFNPSVIPMTPDAVGSGLLGALQRTIALPVKIIKPVFKKQGGKQPEVKGRDDPTKQHPSPK